MPTLSNACCNVGGVVLANTGGAARVNPAVTVMTVNGTETRPTRAHAFLRPITGIFRRGHDAHLALSSIVNRKFRFASRTAERLGYARSVQGIVPTMLAMISVRLRGSQAST